ncbi:hypothetical protein Ari01nite_65600 [Paractinoplanes rishiriensis]|uniref:Uncharacterized protein n=2 Tax=Paractinoplanes rishiriensis TaxID=1050105 RepID=A0A919N031_9ACTN|nr:hypothetical protein Ari01nite_65600 [Actinoplanes rishiriensis]
MTAAGLALIAGGLATLISFRSVLFGGGERRAGRRQRRAIDAPRRRAALAGPVEPVLGPDAADAVPVVDEPVSGEPGSGEFVPIVEEAPRRRGRRGRRRALVSAGSHSLHPEDADEDERGSLAALGLGADDERGGLASIGFAEADEDGLPEAAAPEVLVADDENFTRDRDEVLGREDEGPERDDDGFGTDAAAAGQDEQAIFAHEEQKVIAREDLQTLVHEQALVHEELPDEPAEPVRHPDRYGDRIDGWVRPEYQSPSEEPRPGEYWTPIPVDLGGDPEPSAKGYGWPLPVERLPAVPAYEPATGFDLVPVASEPTEVVPVWSAGDEERPSRIRLPRSWSSRNEKAEHEPRRRPRPRPQPDPPAENRTVYVSRHAADPPH